MFEIAICIISMDFQRFNVIFSDKDHNHFPEKNKQMPPIWSEEQIQ